MLNVFHTSSLVRTFPLYSERTLYCWKCASNRCIVCHITLLSNFFHEANSFLRKGLSTRHILSSVSLNLKLHYHGN
jgi:hypothetical protein